MTLFVKYTLGRVLAAVALILLAPVFLILAASVKVSSRGPVLFSQWRIGLEGHEFQIYKFRSMHEPHVGSFLPENGIDPGLAPGGVEGVDRRTTFGKWLRCSSLDELPQLWNVVKGDMSLVGPRPERPEFVDHFGPRVHRYRDRHRMKSGITGLAQVSGLRGQTRIADRVIFDNEYIDNWSLRLDIGILAQTFKAAFQAD